MCGGGGVSWFSRTQKPTTLSTAEAKHVALGDAVKELLLLRLLIGWRFMFPGKGMLCFPVHENNLDAVQLVQNPVTNSNSKHIDVRYLFLRELVHQRDVTIMNVHSKF